LTDHHHTLSVLPKKPQILKNKTGISFHFVLVVKATALKQQISNFIRKF